MRSASLLDVEDVRAGVDAQLEAVVDALEAGAYPGRALLLDTYDPQAVGGTGQSARCLPGKYPLRHILLFLLCL